MNENQNTEWKESWRDEYLKWICGFANATGGKIYIGMNDNGKVVGVAAVSYTHLHRPFCPLVSGCPCSDTTATGRYSTPPVR